jgi:surface-anchored protein
MKKIALLGLSLLATVTWGHTQSVWTLGHGDIGIGYLGGFEPHWHLGEDGEVVVVDGIPMSNDPVGFEYGAADLILEFSASVPRPAGASFDFLGTGAGEPIWFLPDNSSDSALAGVPFLGFGTEELDPAEWSGSIVLTLAGMTGTGVDGGGYFSLFESVSSVFIQTFDGISAADAINLTAGNHVHYNLAFTQPGIYNLQFEITGDHVADGLQSTTATYTFNVIPEPTSLMLIGLGASALLLRRRRHRRVL